MLRYSRALYQIVEKDWDKISRPDRFEIENLEPHSFKLQNTGANYRAVGVNLKTSIA